MLQKILIMVAYLNPKNLDMMERVSIKLVRKI